MIDLARALRVVVDEFESHGVDYVIVGSAAAAAWGVVRTTRDVDVVIVMSEEALADVLDRLVTEGFYVPDSVLKPGILETPGSFNVLDPVSGGKVDVFVPVPDDAFTASRISRRIRADVFGVPCWVSSAEDVLLAKLRWRLKSRSDVQWRDCVEIASTNDLDRDYLASWAEELAVSEDLGGLLRDVDEAKDRSSRTTEGQRPTHREGET